ncbi:diguanylate cyclase domain-containing protein [Tropicibacter oceani]|uniref:guanylate cyclase n=1 Tax=Tropicibacter oceani TaxID=3058420 RepID=A0ABY8QLW0_9RHOB|nr:diguanylate cyclase [Tropicibacter oceani]WGW05602.1 diguanylate cyclase [Tropicibacter oceani]
MTVSADVLRQLCPMHVLLDASGTIRQAGATLYKLNIPDLDGAAFFDLFEVHRPRSVTTMQQLLATQGGKLHLRLRNRKRTQLKGMLVADGSGGAVINMSFGISVVDAVRDYALTSTDFATTDLAIEMLYLVEAKTAALNASLHLNTRLQGAKTEAEERAYTDGLTGLRNRRAMDRTLEKLCRSGQPFSLIHMDLDFFKQVNDTHGHAAGDLVLRKVAEIMQEETRKDDTAARVGGDEFVLIFPDLISQDRLGGLAARMIAKIEQPVFHDGRTCRVSASIGITINPGALADPELVLEQADQALYASKRAGRAQFTFYDPAVHALDVKSNSALAGE